jgi:hypothetical protein
MTTMVIIYCGSQAMLFWVSRSSGWWDAKKLYQTKMDHAGEFRRVSGELKMGGIRFGRESPAVYKSTDAVLIRGPKIALALGFLYLPDLYIPSKEIQHLKGGRGSIINCGVSEKVYFELID